MQEVKEIKNELKQTPETRHYAAVIKKLLEINKSAHLTIQQNQWTIQALKASLKKSLLIANKK